MTGDPAIEAVSVLVEGLVQGVAYRFHACEAARQAGVVGWVRNLPDGRVEAHVQGDPTRVADMLAWMRRGPRMSRVERLTASPAAADDSLRGFETRR